MAYAPSSASASEAAGATAATTPEPIDFPVHRPAKLARAQLEFREALAEQQGDGLEAKDLDGTPLHLSRDVLLTAQDVTAVSVTLEPDLVHYAVTLQFNEAAAGRLKELTSKGFGTKIAILLDGQVLLAPTVTTPLSDSAMISGHYTRETATQIAEQLAP
jgi:preprotein translocase subunit SecD